MADGPIILVDLQWGEDVNDLIWSHDYLFDLPILGMTLCKVVYHWGDQVVYLRGVAGTENIVPSLTPESALRRIVGKVIGPLTL